MANLSSLSTEQRNPRTTELDQMSPLQIVQAMNEEDKRAAEAVGEVLPQIAEAISLATSCLRRGGRLIYVGAGTSGRLALLDAAECPPTFGVSSDKVIGILAGGPQAFLQAVEGAEDSTTLCQEELERIGLSKDDLVIGLAASGRTPFVVHGLRHARSVGCQTVAIACVRDSKIGAEAQLAIEPETGPEVLTGSTRLKAGTAQKMVLNMISTGAMVGLHKTFQNLMVDVQQTNEKLKDRARRIVTEATDCSDERAQQALDEASGSAKIAIVAVLLGVSAAQAKQALERARGSVAAALEGRQRHGL
ncbi:MAG: N-acetylmuramic acid 6-phosphate etherase [Atopobiaceae bacterium]|nr:N-acetylmuramic acid 6-phosphate etherase [Atopobiaceae bacterium]MBR1828394.1 N-acetylmuramic acid 6-phosphate etherase [Atopobiaceae bacterium]